MPRAIWSGSISFGLVNVPVKLTTAVSTKDVRFNQLHKDDGVRIQQKRICPADGQEVSYDDIVKGYEISPGNYVVVDPDELAELTPAATHTIDIEEFVDLDQIDPIFFDHPYYLVPDTRADKAYALLAQSMQRSGRVAIARMVLRTKQYLCAMRAVDGALVISTLYYDDEVKQPSDLDGLPDADVELNDKELKMAEQLIESLTTKFDPSKYRDEYREQLLEIIERKAEGEELVAQPAGEEPARVVDLMAALEASIEAAKKQRESA
jgi:DNA end-binding protein Ku